MKEETKNCMIWFLFATLLLSLGLSAIAISVNANPISNIEYLQLQAENKLSTDVISEESVDFSFNGGLLFVVVGLVGVAMAVLTLKH